MKKITLLILLCWIFAENSYSQVFSIKGRVIDSLVTPISNTEIQVVISGLKIKTDNNGLFLLDNLTPGCYDLVFSKAGFHEELQTFCITDSSISIEVILRTFEIRIPTVTIYDNNSDFGQSHFRAVDWDNMIIGAAKKSEIIDISKLNVNLATNNSRQIFSKVPGLNIWENDNSGIQLNIGARGLSPNRTSNFNTRQNGYDISADALGYPESYYTPPAQAIDKIELIRGAASLQFGTQFGGLLNFKLKKGDSYSPFKFTSENSYGSFNFINSFNSIEGTVAKGKLNYYGYFQYKRGDGWRPFSEFNVINGFASISYSFNDKISISFEQSSMQYLARQPGGLTDFEFLQNPRQSKRPRNWFKVNWNISAITLDYKINKNTKLNIKNFGLIASRLSIGNLSPINRVDYGGSRDLIKGFYNNFGNETRLLHRYKIFNKNSTLLIGTRIYSGLTKQAQGFGNSDSTGTRNDFVFTSDQKILKSDYVFPSFNTAFFAENYINIGKKFSLTPGLRYEFINTSAKGYYQDLVVTPGANGFDTLRNEAVNENYQLPRSILLAGLGFSYLPNDEIEIYANFSQNYRAVNFNDIRIVNPNQIVDPNLKDESGFNADHGIRGKIKNYFNYDFSLFYLSYNNRIGNIQIERPDSENPTIIQTITEKTNIGNARVFGLESFFEWDIFKTFSSKKTEAGLLLFGNFSWLDGRYLKTSNSFASGKKLEFVAPLTFKSGLNFYLKNLSLSYQISYTAAHYTDATNSESSPAAVTGIIPSYFVMDAFISYHWKWFKLQAGSNNMGNAMYFSRRASSYPGPGILPSDGRSFFISLKTEFAVKKR